MSKAAFARCDRVTAKWEGGKVDHPKDPGGRTAYGVIQRVYTAWRVQHGLPSRDVWKITENERLDIYYNNYWRLVRGDELRPGVDIVVYDCAVNSGPSRSIKLLQASLNARGANLRVDGVFGVATMQALADEKDDDALCAEFCRRRQAFVQALSTFATFGKGWTRRISGVKAQATEWATGSIGNYLPIEAPAPHKADEKAVAQTTVSAETVGGVVGTAGTVGGVISSSDTAKDVLSNAASQIEPYVGINAYIQYAFVVLVLAGVAYAAWCWYKKRKANNALDANATAIVEDYSYEPADVVKSPVVARERRKSRSRSPVRLAGQKGRRSRRNDKDKSKSRKKTG